MMTDKPDLRIAKLRLELEIVRILRDFEEEYWVETKDVKFSRRTEVIEGEFVNDWINVLESVCLEIEQR